MSSVYMRSLNDLYNHTLPIRDRPIKMSNLIVNHVTDSPDDPKIMMTLTLPQNDNRDAITINITLSRSYNKYERNYIDITYSNDYVIQYDKLVDPTRMFHMKIVPLLEQSNKIIDFSKLAPKN